MPKTVTVTLDDETRGVLNRGRIEENRFYLPEGQLPRPLYVKVDKALKALGGKWDRKVGAHVFADGDKRAELMQLLDGRTVEIVDTKKTLQQFFTPEPVVERMLELAGDLGSAHVLEPSAGDGRLVHAALREGVGYITAIEIDPNLAHGLQHKFGGTLSPVEIYQGDFLTSRIPERGLPPYDVVLMNPPFTGNQDIDHVMHAFEQLAPGGRLVAIMSPHHTFANDAKSEAFRFWKEQSGADTEEVDEGAFKESGTNIRTVIVSVTK